MEKAVSLLPASNMAELRQLVRDNVPTVIFFGTLVSGATIYALIGLPIMLLLAVGFLVKIPEKAPKNFERLLRKVIPLGILYPNRFNMQGQRIDLGPDQAADVGRPSGGASGSSGGAAKARENLSGVWKRVRAVNYENFVGAQGKLNFELDMYARMYMCISVSGYLSLYVYSTLYGSVTCRLLWKVLDSCSAS
jgi:hypothetical protein